VRLELRSLSR